MTATATFTIVPLAADPLALLTDELMERYQARLPLLDEAVVLLPERQAAARLRQLLLDRAAAKDCRALLGPRIHLLHEWVGELPLSGQRVIGDHARELLLVEALHEHRGLFGQGNLWALADSLLALFDEMTLNRVGLPPSLEEFRARLVLGYGADTAALDALTLEARIVHTLWNAWHDQMQARHVIDAPTAYLLRLAASLERDLPPLYLAGFGRFNRAEQEWLEQLAGRGRLRLFAHAETDADAPTDTPFARFLHQALVPQPEPLRQRAGLFAAAHPQSPAVGRLVLFGADGAEQEAQAVDLQVRRWLLEGCDHIAVVTENRRLARRVRALLERAGVALQDAAGWALSTTSAAAALERWLQCIEEDFPHQAMLDLLKSPFVFAGEERAARLAEVYRLEQGVILQGNIGRGLERYRRELAYRQRRLPGELGRELEPIGAMLHLLAQAAAPMLPLATGRHPPVTLLAALQQGMEQLGLAANLAADAAGRLLLQELEAMRSAAEPDTPPMAWGEFRAWLGRTLERANFRPPAGGSQVELMGLAQSRLGRYDAIVIAGAEQEYLPGGGASSPFFNEAVRQELGLPTLQERQIDRFRQFRRLLEAAPRIVLTLRRQQDGEEIRPSPWVEGITAFHRMSYGSALEDPLLAAWLGEPDSQVFRCDDHGLPPPPQRPVPPLPPGLQPGTLSASGYQQLINCPYQFFAARGLGLAPPESIREALEKADYGERVHRCLQAFHTGVPGLPGPCATPLTPAARADAVALLERISRQVFAEDLEDNFLHRAWLERWLAVVPAYIDWQLTREQAQWRVEQAELELRRDDYLPGLALKGRIDRIDTMAAGRAVLDYKTGAVPRADAVQEGEAVQLPFYAMLLAGDVSEVQYVAIERERVVTRDRLEGEQLEALRQANDERLRAVMADISAGVGLPAWGDAETCGYCRMRGICRRVMWDS